MRKKPKMSIVNELFLQSVTCSLSVMGFGESIMELTGLKDPWVAKGVAIGLVILLLGKLTVKIYMNLVDLSKFLIFHRLFEVVSVY